MLTKLLLAVALSTASLLSVAEPLVVEPPKLPVATVTEKCKDGCVILDADDIAMLRQAIADMEVRAFEAGQEHEKKSI